MALSAIVNVLIDVRSNPSPVVSVCEQFSGLDSPWMGSGGRGVCFMDQLCPKVVNVWDHKFVVMEQQALLHFPTLLAREVLELLQRVVFSVHH